MTFSKFFKSKFNKLFIRLLCFTGVYLIIIAKQAFALLKGTNLSLFFFPIMVLFILTISSLMFEGDIKKRVSLFIAVYLLSIATDGLFSIILIFLQIDLNTMMRFCPQSGIITLAARLTNLILYCTFRSSFDNLKKRCCKTYVLFTCLLLFAASNIILSTQNDLFVKQKAAIYCFYGMQLSLIIILSTYAVILIKDKTKKEKVAQERAKLSEYKLALLSYTRDTCDELKTIKNNMSTNYETILKLNRLNDPIALEKYVLSLCSNLDAMYELHKCDNLILAIALSEKRKMADDNGIDFTAIINTNIFPFTDEELNAIITNTLDNAFNAVLKVENGIKKVNLNIKKINTDETLIHCTNTFNRNTYINIPFLSSIKPNRTNHGYGTKIVKSIVKKYHGSTVYWKDNILFHTKIIVRGR